MQRLNEKWLKLLHLYITITCLIYVLIYTYFAVQQSSIFVIGKDAFGASLFGYLIAIFIVLYNLFIRGIVRRSNIWIAYVFSVALYAVFNSAIVEVALYTSSFYIFLFNNIVVILMATAFGYVATLFGLAVVMIVYAMTLAGTTEPTPMGIVGDGISVFLRVVGSLFLVYIFRNKYEIEGVNNENYIERYFVRNEVVKLLTDSIGDGVLIIDNEGIIRSANPIASRIIQQDSEDMLGLSYDSVLKIRDLNYAAINKSNNPISKSLESGETCMQEVIIERTAEEQKYIDLNVSSIANRQTKELYGAVIILRDISAKRKEEEARSDFISTASHEMRTPIASIEGFLALAMNPAVGDMDEKPREFLSKAHESTQHLGRLFQDLLISSNAEDGRLVNHPKDVEMGEFLEKQVETYSRLLKEKENFGIRMVVGSDDSSSESSIRPLYYAHVDPDRMNELVSNLIENAIKYGDSKDIEVGITGDNDVVQVYIKDQGIGISSDETSHLFQKFYRVDSSSTRTTGGTGLGLFICRKIVELYGGRIWVESNRGEGSTFFFNIPRISIDNVGRFESEDKA